MPAKKPKQTARVWVLVALIGAGAALLIYIHNSRRVAEDRLVGEWSKLAGRGEPDHAEILWTFRPGGIFRIDAVDRRTGKPIQGLIGQWRVEDGELLLVEDFWNDKDRRLTQTVEQFRVLWASESELELRLVALNGHPVGAAEDLRFRRFGTSGQEPGGEL